MRLFVLAVALATVVCGAIIAANNQDDPNLPRRLVMCALAAGNAILVAFQIRQFVRGRRASREFDRQHEADMRALTDQIAARSHAADWRVTEESDRRLAAEIMGRHGASLFEK